MTPIGDWYRGIKQVLQFAGMVLCLIPIARPLAAQNLVPNPGFEQSDTCLADEFGVLGPHYWYRTNGTPDHLQSCLPYGDFQGLPLNFHTYQEPFEGASCTGLYTYHQNGSTEYREWIMAPLLEPLVVGQIYYCSFWANAAFGGNAEYPQIWLANDQVGMRFTTTSVPPWNVGDPYPVPPNHAHILYPQILSDTVGWTLVNGSFVADSAYQYLMIGQFFSNTLSDTLHFAPPGSVFWWYPRGYTLVDAVCVSASPEGCDLGQVVSEAVAMAPTVYPNPALDAVVFGNASGAVVRVVDLLGQEVWLGQVESDRYVLGVGHWSRGAYVLQVQRQAGMEVVKFVLTE